MKPLRIGKYDVGPGHPVYAIAEVGVNHQGDVDIARKLVSVARDAGCNAVKFQVRTPEVCVPRDMWNEPRVAPWGERTTYIEYKRRMELPDEFFHSVKGIDLIVSAWDVPALERAVTYPLAALKVASACVTDDELLDAHDRLWGGPMLVSTGAVSEDRVRYLADRYRDNGVIMQCTATYPTDDHETNLGCVPYWRDEFDVRSGYSGHERGIQCTLAAVALGACVVERHITLDRSMKGSDHAASLEPDGLFRMVRDIRVIERAMGDGRKTVYPSELEAMKRLRRVPERMAVVA